jgi:transcriptional regulator with XRE-family HTH domain
MKQPVLDPLVVAIRDARLEQEVSLRDLEAWCGVSARTINQWEGGRAAPRLRELRMVATALGLDLFARPRRQAVGPARDHIDEIAVERACAGDAVKLTRAERAAAVEILVRRGHTAAEIASRLRVTKRQAQRRRTLVRSRAANGSFAPEAQEAA